MTFPPSPNNTPTAAGMQRLPKPFAPATIAGVLVAAGQFFEVVHPLTQCWLFGGD